MHPTIQQQQDDHDSVKYANYRSYKQKKADSWFTQQSSINWHQEQLETDLSKDKLSQHKSKLNQLQTWLQQPDELLFKTVPEFLIYLGTIPSRRLFCEFLTSVGKQHLIGSVPKY